MKDVGPGLDWFFFSFLFLACGCPVVPAPFVEKTVFAPLYCLCSFVEDQSAVRIRHTHMLSIPPLNFNGVCCCYFIIILNVTFREGNGNPLQYSCLENPTDWEALWTTVHGVTKSRTQVKWLSKLDCKALHLLSFIGWLNINL